MNAVQGPVNKGNKRMISLLGGMTSPGCFSRIFTKIRFLKAK
jgi:hypothetical protein